MTGDLELDAMGAIITAMSGLDSEARGRVLRWAAERYGEVTPVQQPSDDADLDVPTHTSSYDHFAELFSQANPSTSADKALLAAYWLQVIQGRDAWQSRSANEELKNLGHALPNVTHAMQRNIDKRPQLIIQLKKSGNSQQAQKTYKLTTEGIGYVRSTLLSGSS